MNRIKYLSLFLIFVLLAGILTGCGTLGNDSRDPFNSSAIAEGNGSSNGPVTMTLKQFLDSGPKVGLYFNFNSRDLNYPLDKNRSGFKMYLFENGKIYMVLDEVDENGDFYSLGDLRCGDIAKMTDEELLTFARQHKVTEWVESYSRYTHTTTWVRMLTNDYKLHIHTDETGNSLSYEELSFKGECTTAPTYEWGYWPGGNFTFDDTRTCIVYNSTFTGLIDISYEHNDIIAALYFRTNDIVLTLDNIGDKGIEID